MIDGIRVPRHIRKILHGNEVPKSQKLAKFWDFEYWDKSRDTGIDVSAYAWDWLICVGR